MLIDIDDKKVEIPEHILELLSNKVINDIHEKYLSLDTTFRLGIKTAIRTFIFPMIEKTIKQPVRPPRETDPLMFIIQNLMQFLLTIAKDAEITINTEKNGKFNSPSSLDITIKNQGESGRQLVTHWQKR